MASHQMATLSPQDRVSEEIMSAPSTDLSIPHSRSRSFQSSRYSSEKPPNNHRNPFITPAHSAYPSTVNLPSGAETPTSAPPGYFRSRRIKKDSIEKPWLTTSKDTKAKWQTLIPLIGIVLGFALGVFMVYNGWTSVPEHEYCLIYDDDFTSGSLNTDVWTKEAEVGGYGNGQFEETTITDENVFIKDGMLTIMPTLQDERLITTDNVLNLTEQGICASDVWKNCVAVTNTTNGTIIPPARSGRISTRNGPAKIKYGRIEVEAKLPTGDWLWPAIWMLPAENTYGDWPLSGEIDIVESRGNNYSYGLGGNNVIGSTMHWGPDLANDAWWRTFGKTNALMSTFANSFHVFGLEWSEKYIYMYLDSRLLQVMYNNFKKPLWERGNFPLSDSNGTALVDPWSQTGASSTPFDQDFYLILNVAVGGTNGWFQDGMQGKPWVDASPTAPRDFWLARDRWLPTWTDPSMKVRSIKMWQQKGYNGC